MLTLNLEFKKIDGCANNPEKSSTTKIGEHVPCGYSVSTLLAFDTIEDKSSLYLEEDCMKKFCSSLRQHYTNVINFERKKILPFTIKELN